MKFLNSLWPLFKIVLFLSYVHGESSLEGVKTQNCMNYDGPRPKIYSLRDALASYILQGDPRRDGVDPLGILSENNAYQSRQFNCTYHKPIRWIFQLDPLDAGFNINIDFSQRIVYGNVTEYTANFNFLYFTGDLRQSETKLFSCEVYPTGNYSWCERSFIQVRGANIQNIPVTKPDNSLQELSMSLLKSSMEDITKNSSSECKTHLYIKVEQGNVIKYKWNSSVPILTMNDKSFPTNETTFLDNVFRLTAAKDYGCTMVLPDSDLCTDCAPVGDKDPAQWNVTSEYSLNSLIFYGKFSDGVRIHKGHFSVPKQGNRNDRKFYFEWQITPSLLEEEMVYLEVPRIVYRKYSFEVKCRVSVFQFAYGTIISASNESLVHSDYQFREYWQPNGYREIRKVFTFDKLGIKIVTCMAPLRKSAEWTQKTENLIVEDPIPPSINGSSSNSTEFHKVAEGKEEIMIDCNVSSGNPHPQFEWILPDKVERISLTVIQEDRFNRILFPKWMPIFAGTYQCRATNRFGSIMRVITFENEESTSKLVVAISSSLGAFVLLLGMVILTLSWKIRMQRLDFEKQTQKAIDEFKNGISDGNEDMKHANFSVLQLPYNERFEVAKEQWVIEEKILGSGQFGVVRLGSVKTPERQIKLAVKTLKSSVEIDEFKSFLFELKIMAFLGQHKNIVSLVAACTEGINDRDILIGVEFCDNGCLLDFLRKHRAVFRNMVSPDGKIISDATKIDYADSAVNGTYVNISSFTVSTHDLYRWAYHVASGMEYLRAKKVLHGDLAARNVLLTQRKVAKISDFGLSRVLMNSENYTKTTQTALPWKWMAIESLKDRVFSANSDMWAYGITLTEIFTLGQSPYPGMGWSPDFITKLENGMRMERPAMCTTSIYKLMRSCWDNVPSHRPTYSAFKRKLAKGLRCLSILSHALPPPQGQTKSHPASTPSAINSVILPILATEEENGSIYSNIQRSTMNYYKNS